MAGSDHLTAMTALQTRDEIARGSIKVVELAAAFLERIDAREPEVGAALLAALG